MTTIISRSLFERSLIATAVSQGFVAEASILSVIQNTRDLARKAKRFAVREMKKEIYTISKDYNVSRKHVEAALAEPNTANVLKAFGYSFKGMFHSISAAGRVIDKGALAALDKMSKTAVGKKLNAGAKQLDAMIDKHPILKKITGPVIAGALAYQWMNMSYTGNGDTDFDTSYIVDAAVGNFGVADLVTSPMGMYNMGLMAAGIVTGGALSFPWLLSNTASVATATVFTACRYADKIPALHKLKLKIKKTIDKVLTPKTKVRVTYPTKPKHPDLQRHARKTETPSGKQRKEPPRKVARDHKWWSRMGKSPQGHYIKQHPRTHLKPTAR